jgi:CubicO group peptidase (beta-lactamase class C family)
MAAMTDPELLRLLATLRAEHNVPLVQVGRRTADGKVSVITDGYVPGREPLFPFGSVTKVWTATVILQLADDGDIDLDEPVAAVMPELGAAVDHRAQRITARHLLAHTSGLITGPEVAERDGNGCDGVERSGRARYVRELASVPLIAEPGTVFSYSNSGYVLAGRLIETITGEQWWPAVRSILAQPACAAPTTLDQAARAGTLVMGHAAGGRSLGKHPAAPSAWMPASGLAGTAADLLALCGAHVGRSGFPLLSDELTSQMCRRQSPGTAEDCGLADGWGLGWGLYDGWIGHDGTLDGTTCHLRTDPATGAAVALLTDGVGGLALGSELLPQLTGSAPRAPRTGAPGSGGSADPALYPGNYRNGGDVFVVRAADGALLLTDDSGFRARLDMDHEHLYEAHRLDQPQPAQRGRFVVPSGASAAAGLQFSGRYLVREERPAVPGRIDRRTP